MTVCRAKRHLFSVHTVSLGTPILELLPTSRPFSMVKWRQLDNFFYDTFAYDTCVNGTLKYVFFVYGKYSYALWVCILCSILQQSLEVWRIDICLIDKTSI
jgi:hypothetical protein